MIGLVSVLVGLLFGMIIGRRAGRREGARMGAARLRLELRASAVATARCPLCGADLALAEGEVRYDGAGGLGHYRRHAEDPG